MKIQIAVSTKFVTLARKFSHPVEWLAELACDLFAEDPPDEIIVVPSEPRPKIGRDTQMLV